MSKPIDDSVPNMRLRNGRRFSLRRVFCRRPSTRFTLPFIRSGISDRNKTFTDDKDGSLQSMAGASLNTTSAGNGTTASVTGATSKSDSMQANYYTDDADKDGSSGSVSRCNSSNYHRRAATTDHFNQSTSICIQPSPNFPKPNTESPKTVNIFRKNNPKKSLIDSKKMVTKSNKAAIRALDKANREAMKSTKALRKAARQYKKADRKYNKAIAKATMKYNKAAKKAASKTNAAAFRSIKVESSEANMSKVAAAPPKSSHDEIEVVEENVQSKKDCRRTSWYKRSQLYRLLHRKKSCESIDYSVNDMLETRKSIVIDDRRFPDKVKSRKSGVNVRSRKNVNSHHSSKSKSDNQSLKSRKSEKNNLKYIQGLIERPLEITSSDLKLMSREDTLNVIHSLRSRVRDLELKSLCSRDNTLDIDGKESNYECTLCYMSQPDTEFPKVSSCSHKFCSTCLKQYVTIELTESRVLISCPACPEQYHPSVIASILDDKDLMDKYEIFMIRRVLVVDPDTRWCPAPDCGYAVIAAGCSVCPKLDCQRPGCNTSFCFNCKLKWHPNITCEVARKKYLIETNSDHSNEHLKPCPRCTQFIEKIKDGSCNHMQCSICGIEFCWLCMKEVSDLHYLSPSGCTFWGRKPWTRKKRKIAQIGTLIGAPIIIGIASSIAVPAIIIYSPIWVAKKILKRKFKTKNRRKIITTLGVAGTVLASPLIAAISIGLGVPLMFCYIYIVTPLAMIKDCKSAQQDENYELSPVEEKPMVDIQDKALSITDSVGVIKLKSHTDNSIHSVENRRCSSVDSVGMLDTASTKALAGSLYTRDRDSIGIHDNISVISQTTTEKLRSPQKSQEPSEIHNL